MAEEFEVMVRVNDLFGDGSILITLPSEDLQDDLYELLETMGDPDEIDLSDVENSLYVQWVQGFPVNISSFAAITDLNKDFLLIRDSINPEALLQFCRAHHPTPDDIISEFLVGGE